MEYKKEKDIESIESISMSDFVRLVTAAGNSVKALFSTLVDAVSNNLPQNGAGFVSGDMNRTGWYRIYKGNTGSTTTSAMITIGNSFYNNPPTDLTFCFSVSRYSARKVNVINKTGTLFTKVRILYGTESNSLVSYLEVYYKATLRNVIHIATAASLTKSPLLIEAVDETLPDGYSAEEFTL